MYSNNFYPDGLTEQVIDVLAVKAFESASETIAAPTSGLLDGTALKRRNRRIRRRAVTTIVRTFPAHLNTSDPNGQEAA